MQAIKPALRTMKSGASCPVTFDWGVQGAEFGHVSGPNVDTQSMLWRYRQVHRC